MDFLVNKIKGAARSTGTAAKIASQKAKLKADILFLERDIKNRQQQFGIQLYDYVSVWSARPEFFSANQDNILISTLRPPLIQAQREIAALQNKRTTLKEQINTATVSRTATFNKETENWQQKLQKAGKTTVIAGGEAKLKTELALCEREINKYKHQFGQSLYQQFVLLEDTKHWLPTDREIRSFYDACRKDVEEFKNRIQRKQQEIRSLDNAGTNTTASEHGGMLAQSQPVMSSPTNNAAPPQQPNNFTMSTGIIDAPQPPSPTQMAAAPVPTAPVDPFGSVPTAYSDTPQHQQQQQQQNNNANAFGNTNDLLL